VRSDDLATINRHSQVTAAIAAAATRCHRRTLWARLVAWLRQAW
jgi:hypothetical protein